MSHPYVMYAKLFWQLVKTDLLILKQVIIGRLIDTTIWVTSVIAVVSYIFPQLGMASSFGVFYAVGAILSCSFFEVFYTTFTFVADLEDDKLINYYLTLPIPSWLILVKHIVSFACKATPLALLVLPLSKLVLWYRLDLVNFSIMKFALIFISINILTGSISLFAASLVKDKNHIGGIWPRIMFPLWFFGGSQFSWYTIHAFSPAFGYGLLLNPLIYATEGVRVAVLGQAGYLPFWLCLGIIWVFTLLFTTISIWRLKKRIDFV